MKNKLFMVEVVTYVPAYAQDEFEAEELVRENIDDCDLTYSASVMTEHEAMASKGELPFQNIDLPDLTVDVIWEQQERQKRIEAEEAKQCKLFGDKI